MVEIRTNNDEHWNNDLQDLFDVVDLGLRRMLISKKITTTTYNVGVKKQLWQVLENYMINRIA